MVAYTVPGMKTDTAERVTALLQDRLNSLNDLALTLKHVHWNVTGPNFIAVHTMLDPQVKAARAMADETAHLGALDVVYSGIIEAHRAAIDTTEELDLVTQDMLIGQSSQLEQFHWFVRAHLESADGTLSTGGASTEAT